MVRFPELSYSFDFDEASKLLSLLGNEGRYHIIRLLCENEMCVGAISEATEMTNSLVSHYLAQLRKAKLVENRRSSQTIYYRCASTEVFTLINATLDIRH